MFSRSRWVTTAAGIFGSHSGADRVYRPTELPQYYYLSTPQHEATVCIPFLHCGFLEYWRFWVRPRSWRRRLSQLDSTRVHPAAAPLRPSTVFASSSLCLVPDLRPLRFPALAISSVFGALVVAKPFLARVHMGIRRTLVVFRLPEVGAPRLTS